MDSGNSGGNSSSGDEEYDSRSLLPSNLFDQTTPQFSSISSHPHPQSQTQSSFLSSLHHQTHHHNPSLFDLSTSYLHTLSQSQQNFPNLHTPPSHVQRSEPNCTTSNTNTAGVSSLAPPPPPPPPPEGHNAKATTNIAARNSKKRTRASRRAPTTVLTTDTSNFRAMVQEFTGIPAPPFSGSSYSRRLDLLTASSSLRSTNNSSSHFDTSTSFYPLRPSPQKLHLPNPPSTFLHNNMVDAIASSTNTNISSSATVNNLPHDLGLLYNHHQQQNLMVSMQNQSQNQNQNQNNPILTFHNPSQPLHNFGGFGAKSTQAGLSVQSLEDIGVNHGQVNSQAHLVARIHGHVSSEGMRMTLRFEGDDDNDNDGNGSRRDMLRSLDGSCKLNFSASASTTLNHDKTMENNNNSTSRGEGAVDSWICSSD